MGKVQTTAGTRRLRALSRHSQQHMQAKTPALAAESTNEWSQTGQWEGLAHLLGKTPFSVEN